MTAYEIIDTVCDSVNPILLLLAIGVGVWHLAKRDFKRAGALFALLSSGLLLVYGIMFLDLKLQLWKTLGGDYSTHTAFAIAASVAISMGRDWAKRLIVTFVAYAVAMIYQQYHSAFDIISTSIVIGAPLLLFRIYLSGFATGNLEAQEF